MKKCITLLVIILFLSESYGQNSRRIQVRQKYLLENGKYLDSAEINVPIPRKYEGRQVINEISYSTKPKMIYKIDDVSYAHFALDKRDLKKIDSIMIIIDMTISHYDLNVAKENPVIAKLSKKKRKKYLNESGLYELPTIHNPEVFDAYREEGEIDLARATQNLVENHLTYHSKFGKDMGAKYAWNNAKGDCTEYADLMIALCRFHQIPARRVAGYTVKRESNDTFSKIFRYGSHAWVEAYFEGMGWVPFDPTHSDDSRSTSFEHLQTKYVYYSFDEIGKAKDFWKWWGPGQFKVKRRTVVRDFTSQATTSP
jgi:hypothetical protein